MLRTVGRRLMSSSAALAKPSDAATAWKRLTDEAMHALQTSDKSTGHGLIKMMEQKVLQHSCLADGLSATIGAKLASSCQYIDYEHVCAGAFRNDPELVEAAAADLERCLAVDQAANGFLRIFLFYKGFHCVQCARVAHHYWKQDGGGGRWLATALQSEMSNVFSVDIHPASRWGRGITMDHGTGCVVGETAVIGDNAYLMHDVTLGSTGTSTEHDRHPKIGRGVFLAAKSTVLGNIVVGDNAIIGAHALVNRPVPPGYTAVGSPAKAVPPRKNRKLVAPSGTPFPIDATYFPFL